MNSIELIENNQDFLIVNKPTEISFHRKDNVPGFFEMIQQQMAAELWPVHRLDQMTSGLIIFAKSKSVAAIFGELFEKNEINKSYIAVSDRKPRKKQGKIIGDQKKTRNGNWKLTTTRSNPAVTYFTSCSLTPGYRLFFIQPQTGKTHQIRVALKSLGSPLLGDARYGGSEADRGYLHAYKLTFTIKGVRYKYSAMPTQGELFLLPQLSQLLNEIEPV